MAIISKETSLEDIIQMIDETNTSITKLNSKMSQLQNQVNENKTTINLLINQLDQALIDTQNVRSKSDQAVEQTK